MPLIDCSIPLDRLLYYAFVGVSSVMHQHQAAAFSERMVGEDAEAHSALANEAYFDQQELFHLIYGDDSL